MILQYASDLHLEFSDNKEFMKTNPLQPVGDILFLAGDIVPFKVMKKHEDFFNYVSDNFQTTYWIPGNHEYYSFDAATKCGTLNEKIRDNVFLINNSSVQIGDTNLIFSTLWSKINLANAWEIERGLSDFHVIKYNGKRFSAEQFNQFHDDSRLFINQELERKRLGKTVVITHHVPTFLNYPEKYKGDVLNQTFATELFYEIEESTIDYWIYGHHHNNTPDFEIGKTKMLTNQLGYVKYNENLMFDPLKTITV